jgi:hypothetical protein
MAGIYFILPTLLVILVSFLIVRAAAIALMMTGMDEQRARFQALSAFTGTGFTTKEAETVVSNPRRRRIVMWLMVLGYAGIVTVVVTATSSFIRSEGYQSVFVVLILGAGLYLIYRLARYTGFTRRWENYIRKRLAKYAFEAESPEELLHLLEGYGLVRVTVTPDWLFSQVRVSGETFRKHNLKVIGVERGNQWIPLPEHDEPIKEGDRVIVYGPLDILGNMFAKT